MKSNLLGPCTIQIITILKRTISFIGMLKEIQFNIICDIDIKFLCFISLNDPIRCTLLYFLLVSMTYVFTFNIFLTYCICIGLGALYHQFSSNYLYRMPVVKLCTWDSSFVQQLTVTMISASQKS